MHIWPLPKIEILPFSEIEETRPVALVTSGPAWEAVKERLSLPVIWQTEVSEATQAYWRTFTASDTWPVGQRPEVIYAVGGGLAADAGKYLAALRGLPLVCLPTALSVDAYFTWASGIRQDGTVIYVESKPPERLIIDLEVVAAAPTSLRAAGICDVLSIATGCWDWEFAESKGKNPPGMTYVPYIAQTARAILQGALDCAEAAGRGDPQGLKALLDCLALEVQLCNQIGHARPEEGSEHYFAYAVENRTGSGWPHGDLVGPGILLMARYQGQDTAPLQKALEACHIKLDRIPPEVEAQTLRELPDYVEHHNFPYGISHEIGKLNHEI